MKQKELSRKPKSLDINAKREEELEIAARKTSTELDISGLLICKNLQVLTYSR